MQTSGPPRPIWIDKIFHLFFLCIWHIDCNPERYLGDYCYDLGHAALLLLICSLLLSDIQLKDTKASFLGDKSVITCTIIFNIKHDYDCEPGKTAWPRQGNPGVWAWDLDCCLDWFPHPIWSASHTCLSFVIVTSARQTSHSWAAWACLWCPQFPDPEGRG